MSLIIIGKVAVASLGAAAVGVSGWWFYGWMNRIEGFFLVSDSLVDADKKFKCQVESTKFDCNVIESADLNSSVHNQIKLIDFSKSQTPIETLKTDKLYKIKISKDDFSKIQTKWTDKKTSTPIAVLKKDDQGISLGSIYSGFDTDDVTKKIEYFVGQADKYADNITEYKCFWATASTDLKECKIFPFVENDAATNQSESTKISYLTFKQTNHVASATKQHHYYLIKFTNPSSDSKELDSFTDKELIYAKNTSATGDEKVTFSKISAVKVVAEQLLILKE